MPLIPIPIAIGIGTHHGASTHFEKIDKLLIPRSNKHFNRKKKKIDG